MSFRHTWQRPACDVGRHQQTGTLVVQRLEPQRGQRGVSTPHVPPLAQRPRPQYVERIPARLPQAPGGINLYLPAAPLRLRPPISSTGLSRPPFRRCSADMLACRWVPFQNEQACTAAGGQAAIQSIVSARGRCDCPSRTRRQCAAAARGQGAPCCLWRQWPCP